MATRKKSNRKTTAGTSKQETSSKATKRGRRETAQNTASQQSSPPAAVSTGNTNGNQQGESNGQLRIRMYRVGFGDFFLMTVPSAKGPLHLVIDCGVTPGKTKKGDIGTIKAAVAHMAAETDDKLALIIMTHRHMDHIIGFSRCPEYKGFKDKVDAIWMPVWEKEYDQDTSGKKKMSDVSKLQDEMAALALALDTQTHLAAAGSADEDELRAMLQNAIGGEEMGLAGTGGGTNAASLDLLKHGLGVEPEYYAKGDTPKLPQSLVEAGLTAEILGPPPIDQIDFLKLMDLKKQVGQYLDAVRSNEEDPQRIRPFRVGFEFRPQDVPQNVPQDLPVDASQDVFESALEAKSLNAFVTKSLKEWWLHDEIPDKTPWEKFEKLVLGAQPAALMTAVKQLDNFLNNQSLVVLFTFRGKKLLFAGDAQGGNWEYWLYDGDAPTKTPSAKLGKTGTEVLGHLNFYKVGHHGSTNATPIAAVNAMNTGFVAMCSTQPDSFGSIGNHSEVPRNPLMDALGAKTTLVRSDQIEVKVRGGPEVAPTEGLQKPDASKFEIGSCYVDYFL